jgi:hypothetical protein
MPSIARFEPVIAVTCSLDGSAGRNTRGAQQARLVVYRRDKPGGSLVVHGQGVSVVSSSSAGEQSQPTWTRRAFPTAPDQRAITLQPRPAVAFRPRPARLPIGVPPGRRAKTPLPISIVTPDRPSGGRKSADLKRILRPAEWPPPGSSSARFVWPPWREQTKGPAAWMRVAPGAMRGGRVADPGPGRKKRGLAGRGTPVSREGCRVRLQPTEPPGVRPAAAWGYNRFALCVLAFTGQAGPLAAFLHRRG